MSRIRPSLVRRLLLAFTLGPLAVILLIMIPLRPILLEFGDVNTGPMVVLNLLAAEVEQAPGGQLRLRGDARVFAIAARAPSLWFVIRSDRDQLSFGRPPAPAAELARTLPYRIKEAHFGDVASASRTGDVSIARMDSAAGSLMISVGGVAPSAITLSDWFVFAHHDSEFYLGLTLIMLICLAGGPLAVPAVLSALRPTTRAAAQLDPDDLTMRLSERGVVRELLPLVRAFNAALERLSHAFERRRRFIADVAHELRTPLAVLNMHVDTLPGGATKADLQRTVFRLGQMVGQMLDAERLALAGRKRERVDLVELARGASADIAPLAVASGYDLAFSLVGTPSIVEADPHAITRAVSNLLGNAIAHGGGGGTIEVRVIGTGAIEVSDEGPGVPVEAWERIFEPFHRERWDRDGCGLGLHLVREIMHAHGGQATVIGSKRGATFRLDFPAPRAGEAAVQSQSVGRQPALS